MGDINNKNYLIEELTGKEKKYLKDIVVSARNRYIENNSMYVNNKLVELNDYNVPMTESVLDVVLDKYEEEIKSAFEFEKLITRPELYKIIKALSLKEKMVLFCLYKEEKTLREAEEETKVNKNTVMNRRDRILSKILKQIIEEGNDNV